MDVISLIEKKRYGEELSAEEIHFIVNGYVAGKVKDYQMSALLMAICINSMTEKEMYELTKAYVLSGHVNDFSADFGVVVDKHSTGGVGDKTTLIVAPIVASCGVSVAKMSGRGLGFSGGTIDKLESIKGFQTEQSLENFIKLVKSHQLAIIGQTQSIVPADKLIYALRDVTGTVASIPLIAASIISKKIAGGASKIVIDLKVGQGAFMKTLSEGKKLAHAMKQICLHYERELVVILSRMDEPLGHYVGNLVEVYEANQFLKGNYEKNLYDLVITLASKMVMLAKDCSYDVASREVITNLENNKALEKFQEFITAQGGDYDSIPNSETTFLNNRYEIKSLQEGYLTQVDALSVAQASLSLKAGRYFKDDKIDFNAGVKVHKKIGDYVYKNEVLFTLFYQDNYATAKTILENCVKISKESVKNNIIIEIID